MARDNTTHWHLYVDESGQFSRPSEPVLIGAVAVSSGDDPFLNVRFREMLRRVAPLVPWPFHRWLARKPSMYALWRLDAPDIDIRPELDGACRRAVEIWERKCSGELKKVQRKMKSGNEPERNQILRMRKALKKVDAEAFEILAAHADATTSRIGSLFREVLEAGSERSQLLSFVVGESDTGDAAKDGKGDRYFQMLVCLLERAIDALHHRGGEHLIHVHVAERYSVHPLLEGVTVRGGAKSRTFGLPNLREGCDQALMKSTESGAQPSVRLSAGSTVSYDESVPAGVVVADSIANHLWGYLRHSGASTSVPSLKVLHDCADGYFGIPMTIASGELSLVSATGKARGVVDTARITAAVKGMAAANRLESTEVENVWAALQANQWAAYFEKSGEVVS